MRNQMAILTAVAAQSQDVIYALSREDCEAAETVSEE